MLKNDSLVYGHYKVMFRLAFGAFSAIYKVQNIENGQDFCLKTETHPPETPEYHLLSHEFRVSQLLSNSPFSCQMYEYYPNSESDGIIMELLSDSLSTFRRKRTNPPSLSMLIYITSQCLRCLELFHSHGIIHADIKPSNFVIRIQENNYNVVLLDYGLSIVHDEDPSITSFRNNLGRNPRYLSMHTHQTHEWNSEDDVWALIYSLADFWKDELPWDGRTTDELVLPIKSKTDPHSLLPPEFGFLIDHVSDNPAILASEFEKMQEQYPRNVNEEINYILNPMDPERKPKLVKYVMTKNAQEKFHNQHSA